MLRLTHLLAIILLGASAAALLVPTAGNGMTDAIAFQRTDIAALTLCCSWAAIGLAAIGASRVALAAGVAAAIAAAVGFLPATSNPELGALAPVLLFAPAAIAIAFALFRRVQAMAAQRQDEARTEAEARRESPAAPTTPTEPTEPESPTADAAAFAATEDAPVAATAPQPQSEKSRDAARAMFDADATELFGGGQPSPPANSPALTDPDAVERLQFLRMRASQAGFSEQAAEFWRKLYQEFPDYYPALNSEARVLFQRGRVSEARTRLKKSLEIEPDDATTLGLAARYAGRDGDWDESARLWERLAAMSDLPPDGLSGYIKALVRAGRAEEGRKRFHRYNEMHPNNGRLYAAGGFAAEVLEEFDEAYELWRGAMALEPAAFSHRRRAIHVLTKLGRFSEAAEMTAAYKADVANEPEAQALAEQVAEAAVADGGPDAAAALAMLGAGDPTAWAKLINARLENEDPVGAEEAFQSAVAQDMATPEVLRAGARTAVRAGRSDAAAERWSALIELQPEDADAAASAAVALHNMGDSAAAKKFLAQALSLDPNAEATLRVQASIAAKEKDWGQALDAWKAIGGQAGLDEEVIVGCATALHGLGRTDEADMLAERGIAELGAAPLLLTIRARLADAKGDAKASIARWADVAKAQPQDAAGWRGLIRSHVKAGDAKAAEAALDKGLAEVADVEDLKSSPHVQRLLAAREAGNSPASSD